MFLRKLMSVPLVGFLLSTSLWAFPVAKAPAGLNGLVVFGDSLSDMGNACPKGGGARSNFICHLYPNERFSDGAVWAEHFARNFGWSLSASREGGNNYAFGGATSGSGLLPKVPGVKRQVSSYLEKVQNKVSKDTLVVLWVGGNDFKNGGVGMTSTLENIETSITRLARSGARTFLIPNLPPLNDTPIAEKIFDGVVAIASGVASLLSLDDEDDDFADELAAAKHPVHSFLSATVESLIVSYNTRLAKKLNELERKLKIKIYQPDIFDMFKDLVAQRDQGDLDSASLFYGDFFHPSAHAHKILGNEMTLFLAGKSRTEL